MTTEHPWAQVCILHDRGFAVIGHGYQFTSTSQDPPRLKRTVPVVDLHGVDIPKWQAVLRDYSIHADIEDIDFLVEDLNALKG